MKFPWERRTSGSSVWDRDRRVRCRQRILVRSYIDEVSHKHFGPMTTRITHQRDDGFFVISVSVGDDVFSAEHEHVRLIGSVREEEDVNVRLIVLDVSGQVTLTPWQRL